MSRFHNRNFELLEPYEGKLSRTVLRGERGSNAPDLPDKKYYDALKSVNNLVKDARKVKETILLVGEITDIYVNNFQKMLSDPNYTLGELNSISLGYAKLLKEAGNMLSDLKESISSTGLSMNDKERMEIIDAVYSNVLRFRNLTNYYTRKNISVSFIRAKDQGDLQRVTDLYGRADRYW